MAPSSEGLAAIPSEAWPAAQTIWDYMRLVHEPGPGDAILCLGSQDIAAARHAAHLWLAGLAPYIVMSGGIAHQDDLANTGWGRSEAEVFAEAARTCGVPPSAILLEREATNTGENFTRSRSLIAREQYPPPKRLLVVAKPYMTRRGFATGSQVWPGVEFIMACEKVSLADYLARWENPGVILNLMVGDLHRMIVYPSRGFQIRLSIPAAVHAAFDTLVELGFRHHLIRGISHRSCRLE